MLRNIKPKGLGEVRNVAFSLGLVFFPFLKDSHGIQISNFFFFFLFR